MNENNNFILLTMLLFIKLFWYKEGAVSLVINIYHKKCIIYIFVSNLRIFKVMNQHFLGVYKLGNCRVGWGWGVQSCEHYDFATKND